MSILILHLTDLHIETENDAIISRCDAIANTLNHSLTSCTALFITVSGDIAQAGLKDQYEVAAKFLNNIKAKIKKEKDIPIEFILVPGNHDCDFSNDQLVRNIVLKDIGNHAGKMPVELINALTDVQSEYFNFRDKLINRNSLVQEDKLWTVQEFSVEGTRIWFDSLNASWMSTIHEKPGTVFFPFESYRDFKSTDADLRIALIHHPLNWFSQINYQNFRTFLQTLEDFVISGHEHAGNASVRQEANGGECAFIEGCALQIKTKNQSGFNVIELKVDTGQFSCEKYEFVDQRYERQSENGWFPIRPIPQRLRSELQITGAFRNLLNDPGAPLHHPDKPDLQLDDFYVFPDLDIQTTEAKPSSRRGALARKKSSKSLTSVEFIDKNIILEGDENSGKTRLLFQLYSAYHLRNYVPIYLDGRKIKSSQTADLTKLFSGAVVEQYGTENVVAFEQTNINKKIVLIDDFDQTPIQDRHKDRLYEFIENNFSIRILTVGESYRMSELFSGDTVDPLSAYIRYKILPFGYERRGELVRKWNRLGLSEVAPNNQWLNACTQAEKLIEAARLQHIATTVPIMVLSLLNLGESGLTKEMHNSSFAHYFYFLIVGALSNAGVRQDSFSKYLGYCTHLSWFFKNEGIDLEISEDDFRRFCTAYSKNWTLTSADEMLETLTKARILDRHGDVICFTYQYAYFYFLGRYTNSFIDHSDVENYLSYCMNHLYVRECANTLLFLAHHSGNSLVLDGVTDSLIKHFEDVKPVTFSKDDVKVISSLISNAPALVYQYKDPVQHRTEVHKIQDQNDDGGDGLSSTARPDNQERDFMEEITSVSKTIEIAGALLTNQFANLRLR